MDPTEIMEVPTRPFPGQRPGTSGLRKKTRVFRQPHYLENFVQSVFDSLLEDPSLSFAQEILVLGGDGRYYNRTAIQTILRMAVANGFGTVLVARGGILSTPAMSASIRRHGALGGLLLTASHNPGGPDEDFGIKYNVRNGGPAPEQFTERVYRRTQSIACYRTLAVPDQDIERDHAFRLGETEVRVIDPLQDYTDLMTELFDFTSLRRSIQNGLRIVFDAMHGVTGPYAVHLFENILGAPAGSVLHATPLEDFGGGHPDPNLVHARSLVERMSGPDAPDLGAACDGDGDRNMILGPGVFVSPGDSLALIAEHAQSCIPAFRSGLRGVARSMPTSTALDRVAQTLRISCYETPTGWKFFGNLMDAGLCSICGEESFGTGSDHIREKDGLWAVLAWLSILSHTGRSLQLLMNEHWSKFGRSFYQRHDYEGLDTGAADAMYREFRDTLGSLPGQPFAGSTVRTAEEFSYLDPVDGSASSGQGLRIVLWDGSRVVGRLSGTGTEGATFRLYVEKYRKDPGEKPVDQVVGPLLRETAGRLGLQERFGLDRATVVT